MFHDTSTIIFVMFLAAIVCVVLLVVLGAWNAGITAIAPGSLAAELTNEATGEMPAIFDWIIFLLLIGLPLIAFGLAFINNIPAIFFWLSAAVIFVTTLIGLAFSNLWGMLGTSEMLLSTMMTMQRTHFIMENFGIYSVFVFFLIAAGTYVKMNTPGRAFI